MKPNVIKHIIVGFLMLVGQIMIFRHLRIFNAEPDMMLIFLLWIMHHYDRTRSLLFTAAFALLQDATLDLWGLHLFSKVATVMFFHSLVPKPNESKPQTAQIALIFGSIVLFHNVVLLGLSGFVQSLATWANFTEILFGNTIFTTIIGTFLYLFKSEQN